MNESKTVILFGLTLAAMIFISCDQPSAPVADATPPPAADSSRAPVVTVYKSPTCGCCSKWGRHLEDAGLEVTLIDVPDVGPIKAKNGLPEHLASCHTAIVEGYVVEGHVPAEDVLRLLDERPKIAGLAVPGMPIGSPGMEGPNPESYLVFAFDADGGISNFARHGP